VGAAFLTPQFYVAVGILRTACKPKEATSETGGGKSGPVSAAPAAAVTSFHHRGMVAANGLRWLPPNQQHKGHGTQR
jgi:hypothetical protein